MNLYIIIDLLSVSFSSHFLFPLFFLPLACVAFCLFSHTSLYSVISSRFKSQILNLILSSWNKSSASLIPTVFTIPGSVKKLDLIPASLHCSAAFITAFILLVGLRLLIRNEHNGYKIVQCGRVNPAIWLVHCNYVYSDSSILCRVQCGRVQSYNPANLLILVTVPCDCDCD